MNIQINRKRWIGDNYPTYIIAEIGSNHNQDIDTAKELIDIAASSGADAVKFQSLKFEALYQDNFSNKQLKELFYQIQLKEDWYSELNNYCERKGIVFFSAPTYFEAVDLLEQIDVEIYKIASPQTATFPQLIDRVAKTQKPIILSTGYCDLEDIYRAVNIVKKTGNNKLILLHCISEYPTQPHNANLRFIEVLKKKFNVPVGFSDHTLGWAVTLAAVALGANVIEKHITLSRQQKGPDHFFAIEPDEFEKMISDIRDVEVSKGEGEKILLKNEKMMLDSIRMGTVSLKDLKKGTIIDLQNDITFRRNCEGIDAWDIFERDNIMLINDIQKGMPIRYSDINISFKPDNSLK